MRVLVDAVALVLLVLLSPVWLVRRWRRGRRGGDWRGRLGFGPDLPPASRPRVLIHAVSVGEVAAVEPLVERLRVAAVEDAIEGPASGPLDVVISVTTATGLERARQLFGDRHEIVRTPLAFHASVAHWLRRIRPDLLVLVELEVWPSIVAEAGRRAIPVVVVNGRLTERSLRRYLQIRRLVAPAFGRLAACAVQDEPTAARFAAVGADPARIRVTGTMKWDRAVITDTVEGADELAAALGVDRHRPLVVAGSTAPDETRLIHEAVGDAAQLICAPRKPEWFDGAAADLPGCVRRSRGESGSPTGRFLLDTIGELRAAYALADVVVVGRSFGDLHGSDMMEPVGLGKPVVIGPRTGDFASAMEALRAGDGIRQVTREELPTAIADFLADPAARSAQAERGRTVIRERRGAAARHERLIREVLAASG